MKHCNQFKPQKHIFNYATHPSPLEFLAKERAIAHGVRPYT